MAKKILAGVVLLLLIGCGGNAAAPTETLSNTEVVVMTEKALETAAATPTVAPTPTADINAWKREEKAKGFVYDEAALTYELVWADEFDGDAVDKTKWSFETGGSAWGNNELEYYTDGDNAEVVDGRLVITARVEDKGGRNITSSRMVTRNKGDWTYGKIEVKAKIPKGLGTWPAIWMMPTKSVYGGWPDSGEIDIMEHVGYDLDTIVTSVHTNAWYHKKGTQKNASAHYDGISDDFHVYSIEWLPDKIKFFVDETEQFAFEPAKLTTEPTYHHWPFDRSFYVILNVAFGGDWGGAKGIDMDCLPVTMEVDYVRVYQSPEIAELTKK